MDELQTAEQAEAEKTGILKDLHKELIELGVKIDKRWGQERCLEEISRKQTELAQIAAVKSEEAKIAPRPDSVDEVMCRVLPMGNRKISKGVHRPGKGDFKWETGEKFKAERAIAEGLQARGLAEIIPDAAA